MLSRTTPQEPARGPGGSNLKEPRARACMDAGPLRDQDLLALVPGPAPAGLGGCRACGGGMAECDYNVTVFDGPGPDEYRGPVRVSHADMSDMRPEAAVHYLGMRVLRDGSWELSTALSALRPGSVLSAYARGRAVEAAMCCTRSEGADGWHSAMWAKAAALHLAEAVMAGAGHRPSPTHGVAALRGSRNLPVRAELGLERASPTLLGRMCESVIGIAATTGSGLPARLVRAKREAMSSMPAACYLYLASLAWRLLLPAPADGGMARLARVAMDLDAASPGAAGRLRPVCGRMLGAESSF